MDMPSKECRLTRARIEPVSDWQFQFPDTNDVGFVASVLVIRGWSGELIELAAWKPEAPGKWWLRSGLVPLLGEDLAELATIRREPTYLVETPAAWWQATKDGMAVMTVLDWSNNPRLLLTGLRIHCSPGMDRRLKAWHAEHSKPNFSIVVEGPRRAA